MIQLNDLRKSYPPGREVLRGIDLEVAEGAYLSIVGRSGSGKTTLLNIMGGLDSRYSGSVRVAGHDLGDLDDEGLSALRNASIGFLFQSYHLIEHLSVAENAALTSLFDRRGRIAPTRELRRRAVGVLEEVGLAPRADCRPGELSGGERQRLALARALFNRPRVLLCDEPTGNLDAETGAEVVELLERIYRDDGVTVIVASHDPAISRAAERELRLTAGKLEESP
jgi:ABC-type lipoprotein export system ATPase subunit